MNPVINNISTYLVIVLRQWANGGREYHALTTKPQTYDFAAIDALVLINDKGYDKDAVLLIDTNDINKFDIANLR
jgi:hypothetical protein